MCDFFDEIWNFYMSRRWLLRRRLGIKRDYQVEYFCRAYLSFDFDYLHMCRLCMVFSGVLGERLPDSLHARMVLGERNRWVEEYIVGLGGLKPLFWGINLNRNRYPGVGLGDYGYLMRYARK